MRVVVAPDKFKGSLTAVEVAGHVRAGLRAVAPATDVVALPVADGGDGTVDVALAAGFEVVPVTASGPTGEPVRTRWARRDDLAIVEMATVCGLMRLPDGIPDPLCASSIGLGEAVGAALAAGCTRIVLAIGGSASTDGGAGMLAALGAVVRDADGRPLRLGGAALAAAASLDLSGLDPRLADVEIVVACDVDNPLCGPNGAAAVYGPQKGATRADVETLDAALGHWADLVAGATGEDHRDDAGAGAAGGVSFAAGAVFGATLRPGIDIVLDLLRFSEQLAGADLVVTGEGALDEQTLAGKAPAGVAAAARAAGVPVVAVTGHTTLSPERLQTAGIDRAYALTDLEPDVDRCIAAAGPLLEELSRGLAADRVTGVTTG
ncbi:glycerate kinase [Pseudonocardia sp. N23]|uniref:glycerate kinase n=1 Tax=Pseudonocardia sp. N23 TaxID=1987376 RepID=UPI000BFE393A|nr:glycerate kinase [Pseudonocardia sp. N23]GAY09493.1 glycerate kinase [Pseudonocardia sp. N23]